MSMKSGLVENLFQQPGVQLCYVTLVQFMGESVILGGMILICYLIVLYPSVAVIYKENSQCCLT